MVIRPMPRQVPDYYVQIINPVDLSMMAARVREGDYYRSKEMFRSDLQRMASRVVINHSHVKVTR